MFPPAASFTEKDLPTLAEKVRAHRNATGASPWLDCRLTALGLRCDRLMGRIGKAVARMLYEKHAKVYIAARNEQKANAAIDDIRQRCVLTLPGR